MARVLADVRGRALGEESDVLSCSSALDAEDAASDEISIDFVVPAACAAEVGSVTLMERPLLNDVATGGSVTGSATTAVCVEEVVVGPGMIEVVDSSVAVSVTIVVDGGTCSSVTVVVGPAIVTSRIGVLVLTFPKLEDHRACSRGSDCSAEPAAPPS